MREVTKRDTLIIVSTDSFTTRVTQPGKQIALMVITLKIQPFVCTFFTYTNYGNTPFGDRPPKIHRD